MALFSKKPKSMAGKPGVIYQQDEVLGYLDEVIRQRLPISIRTKQKNWDCSVYSFDLKKKVLRIEDISGLEEFHDKAVTCGFALDNTWFLFSTKVMVVKGKPYLMIPQAIQHKERRQKPRTTISIREKVKVTALQGLGAGLGITGSAVEISEGAVRMTIERSLMLENERKVSPSLTLIKPGTDMAIVKISGLSGVPTFQVGAKALRITQQGGWKLALKLEKVPKKIQVAIGQFIKPRYMPYKPTKRSYARRMEYEREKEENKKSQDQEVIANSTEIKESTDTPRSAEKITFANSIQSSNPLANLSPESAGIAPKPEPTPEPPPPKPKVPRKPVLLSIGEELKSSLVFLEKVSSFRWVHVESPLKIIKTLNEEKPVFLFSTMKFKSQSMLDYLEKIANMGVLAGVNIVLFSDERVAPKDLIRGRMLGVKVTFQLPLEAPAKIIEMISADNTSN